MHSKQKFIIKGDSWTKTCNKQICLHLVWEKSSSWNRRNSHKLEQDNKKHAHKYTNYFRLYGISRAVTFFKCIHIKLWTNYPVLIPYYSSVISYCKFLWSYELLLHFENSTFLMITTCKLYFLIESFEKCIRSAAEGCCWRKMEKDERRWWFFVGKTQIEGKLLRWEESSSSSKAQKILYIFAVNATLSNKKEGDLNYFNFKSWKLSFHLQKEVLFSQLDLFSFFPIIFVEDPFIFWNEKKRSLLKL